jgi:hypothetical protein
MTVSVTMLQTRRGEDGNLWLAGVTYSASDEFARQLIVGNYATGTLPDPMQSYQVSQLVATAAEIAAMDGEPGVLYVERDGAQRMFRWVNGAMLQVSSDGTTAANAMPASDILPVLGVMTSLTPTTPANEYVTTAGALTGTDSDLTWGGHQSTLVRMADLTVFAIAHEVGNLVLRRSATGGAYGSAWSTIATISNASRAVVDLDAHLLRCPETDHAHLITSDSNNRIRVRTYSSAGTLVSDILVPDIYPGYNATLNWFRDGGVAGTAYSSASIGADGTIAICRAVTSTPPAYYSANMVAGLHVQTLRWDGAKWRYSGARLLDVGPRLSYCRLWVSPAGHEGYIVGLGCVDVAWKEWTQANNPNYNGTWANTIASSTFFGGARFPEFRMFKIPLATLDSIAITTVLGPNYRTTDISSASPASSEYGAYTIAACTMDKTGRMWITYNGNEDFTTNVRSLIVVNTNGSRAYTLNATQAGNNSAGQIEFFHEDLTGKVWLGWGNYGAALIQQRIVPTTESGGVLTVPAFSTATDLATGAWGQNLTTSRWEGFLGLARLYDERSGSVRTHNWIEFMRYSPVDHTGVAPGTAVGVASDGTLKAKRVRIQLPI